MMRLEPRRDSFGRWLPGETGNAAGRPPVVAEVRALARLYTMDAVLALVQVANDEGSPPAARGAAAREILDRGWGRPRPAPEGAGGPIEEMSDEELAEGLDGDPDLVEAAALVGVRLIEGGPGA